MSVRRFVVPILVLAAAAIPASATITYSSCSSGCGVSDGTYSAWQSAGSFTFSASPITFTAGDLSGGVYTDSGTGTIFNGFSSTTPEALGVSGTSLVQPGSNGAQQAIQIQLPSNTYAFAMMISSTGTFASVFDELVNTVNNFNSTNGQYNIVSSSSGNSVFFGIVSDTSTPLTNSFVGDFFTSFQSPIEINSFEIGQQDASPTPEGSTMLMIGGGLIVLRLLRRRPRTKPSLA